MVLKPCHKWSLNTDLGVSPEQHWVCLSAVCIDSIIITAIIIRFIRGAIKTNQKLFPIPLHENLKYNVHWQFLTVSKETIRKKYTSKVFLKMRICGWSYSIVGKMLSLQTGLISFTHYHPQSTTRSDPWVRTRNKYWVLVDVTKIKWNENSLIYLSMSIFIFE